MNGTYHRMEVGPGGTYVYKKGEPPHHQLLYRGDEERWILQQGYDKVQYRSTTQSTMFPSSGVWQSAQGGGGEVSLQIQRGPCGGGPGSPPAALGGGGRQVAAPEGGEEEEGRVIWRDCGGCGVHLYAQREGSVRLGTSHEAPLGTTFRQLQRFLAAHGSRLGHLGDALPASPYLHPRTRDLLRQALPAPVDRW